MGELNLFSDLEISTFTIENSGRSLFHQIKGMRNLISRGHARHFEECELFVLRDKVIFRINGCETYVNCRPTEVAKAKLYFVDLLDLLREIGFGELNFTIQKTNLLINNRTLSSKGERVSSKDDSFQLDAGLGSLNFHEVNVNTRNIDIPSWQSEVYILKTTNERIHMNALMKDAEKAALLLKKYKVDSNKILHLMMDNLDQE